MARFCDHSGNARKHFHGDLHDRRSNMKAHLRNTTRSTFVGKRNISADNYMTNVRMSKHICAIRHIQRSKPLRFPSPTPSQVYTPPAPKSRKVLDFSGFVFDFLPVPNTQKMKQLQKPPQIIKKTTFVHPRLQFSLIVDAFWHQLFMLFHDSVKSPKL